MIFSWKIFLEKFIGETPISNYQSYNTSMSRGISDKLFFIDKTNFDGIVDFGCADGLLLSKIHRGKLIGYDLDDEMISIARSNLDKRVILTSNWNEVLNNIQSCKSPLLNLSSVIHEVYSYSSSNEVKRFWEKMVFGGDFKFITIRDMIPSVQMDKSRINDFKEDVKKIRRSEIVTSNKKYLESFENRWGSINTDYRTFLHFLLKYRYVKNWEREVNENYLPLSLETLKSKIPDNYKIVYEDNFIFNPLKDRVKLDFGVDIRYPTHTKMIIKNLKF